MHARNDARVKSARALTNSKILSYPSANRSFEGVPRSLNILVADDERDTVLTLTMILKDEGGTRRPRRLHRVARSATDARI
jgi:hypothetical protein